MDIEARGVQPVPVLSEAPQVLQDMDPSVLRGPIQHPLALDLHLLQLDLLLWELSERLLWTHTGSEPEPGFSQSQHSLSSIKPG